MAFPQPIYTTPEEYLKLDRNSPVRYEYMDGHAYALAGGTLDHSTICVNLVSLLHHLLQGSPCRVYNSDARVRLSPTRYVYPDLTISCDAQDRGPTDVLTAPRVVIEVLSPSTEGYDRGEKFSYYRECPSLQEYVLVASERQTVEVYFRQEQAPWGVRAYGQGDEIALTSIDVRFPLDAVYAGVTLP